VLGWPRAAAALDNRKGVERMWRCTRCESEFDADQAEANLDDFGLHFMCPGLRTTKPTA